MIDLAVLENARLMLVYEVRKLAVYSEVVLTRANLQESWSYSFAFGDKIVSDDKAKILAFFEHAREHPTRDIFVTGFIGNHLKGWIQCWCTVPTERFPRPERYFATYDFSTIYDRLQTDYTREGFHTSQ
jgi:hypothetical protein